MKNNVYKTLKFRIYAWYFFSLIVLSIYFYVIVHVLMLPHSDHIFVLLLTAMALSGYILVKSVTKPISDLTNQIRNLDKRNLDIQIKKTNSAEEIEILTDSFNKLLSDVNKTMKREQQFIGDVAHEIKTPLASIQTSLEVALRNKRSEKEYEEIIKDALKDTDRIKRTLSQVLDLAWAESQQKNLSFEKVNISELLNEVVDITTKLGDQKKLEIKSVIPQDVYVIGQKEKLAQMLINITENAINYTDRGGIKISLKNNLDDVRIIVQDTGRGIAHEEKKHIFERFYRGTSSSKTKGTGIGLSIAKSIIKMHGGDIDVQSNGRSGSTFVITLRK